LIAILNAFNNGDILKRLNIYVHFYISYISRLIHRNYNISPFSFIMKEKVNKKQLDKLSLVVRNVVTDQITISVRFLTKLKLYFDSQLKDYLFSLKI